MSDAEIVTTHHRYSPSKLDSLALCVRFDFRRTDTMEEAGDEGTLLHAAVETNTYVGLTEEQESAARAARAYGDALRAKYPDAVDTFEERVVLKDLTFGHCDRNLVSRAAKLIIIIDHKFERASGIVHDMQLRAYGAAKAEMLADDPSVNLNEWTVQLHVIAPRLNHSSSDEYKAAALVKEVREQIVEIYERREDPFTPPTPDAALCARCSRAAKCPAINQLTREVLTRAHGIDLPDSFNFSTGVTPEQRAAAQALKGVLENLADQIGEANKPYAAQGLPMPGFVIRQSSSGKSIPRENTAQAIERLLAIYNMDQIATGLKLSINQMAEAVAPTSTQTAAQHAAAIAEQTRGLWSEGTKTYYQKAKRGQEPQALLQELMPMALASVTVPVRLLE